MEGDPYQVSYSRKAHPLAALFPMMDDASLKELAEDIKANGQQEPIKCWKNLIIDGRNRQKACQMAGVMPDTYEVQFEDEAAVARYICSMNIHRRHLTTSQRAMIAVEIKKPFAEAAKVRQLANLKQGDIAPVMTVLSQRDDEHENKARKEAASVMGVGEVSVQKAQAVKAASPELAAKVAAGEVTVNKAYTQVKAEEKAKAKEEELPIPTATAKDYPPPVDTKLYTITVEDHLGDIVGSVCVPKAKAAKVMEMLGM